MGNPLPDERLAWLAVRDYVCRKTQPPLLLRVFSAGRSDEANDYATEKHQTYAIAVDDAVQDLTADDRAMLRRTGHVSDWFIARVEELYRMGR